MDHEQIGKYRIVGELGRGTMGAVYKAHDPVLNRFVALKTILEHGGGEESLQRFQREAQAAALLNHPNIVTVHDFGRERGLLFMAMELLEGTDLRQKMDSGAFMSLEEKLGIADSVLAALEYAHDRGVVHRDIKPANIRIGSGGQVKLVDFGLAKVNSSEMTQDGIVLGTPNYMSPEQALGERVDGRSDLFSAGAVLYEMLTGHRPFEAETTPSVLFLVVHKDPPPVRQWTPTTPAPVAEFVERSLQKDRERRFSTAEEMRGALSRIRADLTNEGSGARPAARAGDGSGAGLSSSGRIALAGPPLARPGGSGAVRPAVVGTRPSSTGPIATGVRRPPPVRPAGRSRQRGSLWPWLAGVAIILVVVAAGGLAWLWLSRQTPAPAAPPTPRPELKALAETLLATQLRLARHELQAKNYEAAARQAEGVLRELPANADAQRVLDEARKRLLEVERVAAAARARHAKGDRAGLDRQLKLLRELDPRNPAIAELTTQAHDDAGPASPEPAEAVATATAPVAEAATRDASAAPSSERRLEPEPAAAGSSRPADFARARLLLEAEPAVLRAGQSFLVRIRLANDGTSAIRLRGLELTVVNDDRRKSVPLRGVRPRELAAGSVTLLAEYSGTWYDITSWALEATATSERDQTLTARLRAR